MVPKLIFQASLEAVRTAKSRTDDIERKVTISIYNATAAEIGALDALYQKPLKITIEEE